MGNDIQLVIESSTRRPPLETAISRVVLEAVSDGTLGETFRMYRTEPILAFGPQDLNSPGYRVAMQIAQAAGFECVQRLAGGRAAVFHQGTLGFAWTIPDEYPKRRIKERFNMIAEIVSKSLLSLGVDASIGAVPGEYCPGDFSVNARGKKKIMGVGQRVISSAAHIGGVIVAKGSDSMRRILVPVYGALELEWDPETVGSVEDEIGSVDWQQLQDVIVEELSKSFSLQFGTISGEVIRDASAREHLYACKDVD